MADNSIELQQYKTYETKVDSETNERTTYEYFGNFATRPYIHSLVGKILEFDNNQFNVISKESDYRLVIKHKNKIEHYHL